uniref:Claudin n=1 Tax=Monopterus albus TaxID=43700 RepID=A0A3Q3K8G3_MONAL|nr:claudin-19-like [Monopterus albus]
MANSGLQLLGFILSLVGLAATISATFMVQWKKQSQSKAHRVYEGLWMTCSGNERTTCDPHDSVLKLPPEVQATRAVLLFSILLSAVAVMISIVGMKCTHFMDAKPSSKSLAALIGGILFMSSGLLTIIITSWYVKMIVNSSQQTHRLQSLEFGKAVFVSGFGGFLTMGGGAFLSCRRCSKRQAAQSISSNHLLPTAIPKSNYV